MNGSRRNETYSGHWAALFLSSLTWINKQWHSSKKRA